MFDNVLRVLTPNYQKLSWQNVLLVLVLVTLFIRFPFFFRDYVDRDESTFIIMGQSWVNGHLPYTHLWDLKPPITFLFFASIITIFGKSFIAIRLFGALLVALTAFFTYLIGLRVTSPKISFWSAMGCVCLLSLFGSLQGVMSEHISTFFFTLGVYILLSKKPMFWYFGAGVLFGLSIMSKLNMAYPLLALGIYLVWYFVKEKTLYNGLTRLFLMGLGTALLIGLTALPYYLEGSFAIWWKSIFEAPIAYSKSKYHSPLKILPLVIAVFLFFGITYKKSLLRYNLKTIQVLFVTFLGVVLSFIQTGKVNGHYLIQLYPFIVVPVGILVDKLPKIKPKFQPLLLFLALLPMEAYLEYGNIIANRLEKGTFFNGEGVEVPRYLKANDLGNATAFFTEYHIGYWLMDASPPTVAATHPSNITREELFPYMDNPRETAMQELRYILEDIRPKLLIARKGKRIFDKKREDLNQYIDSYLEAHYILIHTVDSGLIYQRLD